MVGLARLVVRSTYIRRYSKLKSKFYAKGTPCNIPAGYEPVGGGGGASAKHYKGFSTEKTFLSARAACADDGGWLAMFKTPEELQAVRDIQVHTGTYKIVCICLKL